MDCKSATANILTIPYLPHNLVMKSTQVVRTSYVVHSPTHSTYFDLDKGRDPKILGNRAFWLGCRAYLVLVLHEAVSSSVAF